MGAALPDAVQYYRMRKLQEMGCNALRTSHNPPTPELLDACDELGMLVFDETRMMSSNPEGLEPVREPGAARPQPSQRLHVVDGQRRRPGKHREGHSHSHRDEGSRHRSMTARGRSPSRPSGAIGTGGLAVCDVMGYNYMDPGAEAYHKAHPDKPVMGTETVSAVGTRGIYITDPRQGLRRLLRPLHHHRPRLGGGLVELLQCAAVARRRLRLDRLRLSRRAFAL